MAFLNAGKDSNSSQFFFTLADNLTKLNGKHVVFGQVVEGVDILHRYPTIGMMLSTSTDVFSNASFLLLGSTGRQRLRMEAPRSTLSSLIAVSVKLFELIKACSAKETCAKISCEAQLDGVGQEKVTGLLLSKR
jgi:hypothetical protein